jgi:hypothetical protein
MKRNYLSAEDEQQLKAEIQHIFDSGENEVRIFEMVKLFINQRQEKALTAAYHQGSSDFYNSSDKDESEWKTFNDFLNFYYPLDVIEK